MEMDKETMNINPLVSVIVTAFNESNYIEKCINSLLAQSYADFELIIVDDCSTDDTSDIIKTYKDERISYIRNLTRTYIPKSRNIALHKARGKYIFFTDADCIPSSDWIEEGLRVLKQGKFIGVQGKTYYEIFKPTLSDRVVQILEPDNIAYSTCNIAYIKDVLDKVNGFDEKYYCVKEDTDLALRVLAFGEIFFSEKMTVTHQRKFWNKKTLSNLRERAKLELAFLKQISSYKQDSLSDLQRAFIERYKSKRMRWKIYDIGDFFTILFPFHMLINYKVEILNRRQMKDFFLRYVNLILLRFCYWKAAFKERLFII